ncbi:MAG: phosphoglycerate dehydrogenase [Negativicutes bacterium]|nr:phosphoglycerate dehydrogenase [Negativicutes bacterium]
MAKRVLITAMSFRRSKEAMALLQDHGYEIILSPYHRALEENEMLELMTGVSAMVVGNDAVTEKVIAAGVPSLEIIARSGAGYNTIDVAAARRYGIPVTYTPGANNKSVADLTLGLMISLARSIPRLNNGVHSGGWEKHVGQELGGKTLGVVGTGNIGAEAIKRAVAFDMKIVAYDVHPRADLIEKYEVIYLPLAEVIAQSDFLSLHVPAIPETVNMINKTTLRAMKPTAFLINTARGELVVEADLGNALKQGIIAGAALDAFVKEPLEDSCLYNLPNVILTPHIGANTGEASGRVGIMAAEEVIGVLSGSAPRHPVN